IERALSTERVVSSPAPLFLRGRRALNLRTRGGGLQTPTQAAPLSPNDLPESIFIGGNNAGSVSYKALVLLAERKVPLVIIGKEGVPLGAFTGSVRTNGNLRLAQMKCRLDERLRLQVARAMVESKTGESF